ncbi:MAG: hypothetical protein BroJett013_07330 [Alphaproteobacteria bacterium]|nr:MAG: hypothetical protein BroJett013_07330 [Alphaproteobacteria bacterium]
MRLVAFEPDHLFMFAPQQAQAESMQWMTPDIAEAVAAYFSFTGIDESGEVVGCAGIAPAPKSDDYVAWAVFADSIGKHALALMKAVKRGLELYRDRRIVAHVDPKHLKAARFAETLNFRLEPEATVLHPSGTALHVYVRGAHG